MPIPILATKLYAPALPPKIVPRPRLSTRLNAGLRHNQLFGRKLTLVSAPAGFGKTTLVCEWLAGLRQRLDGQPERRAAEPREASLQIAWLSLDESDNDLARFLTYLVAALQTIAKDIGAGVIPAVQTSPGSTSLNESLLTTLLNEIAAVQAPFFLVLDDYHMVASELIDQALTFLLDHLPPQMHIVITTRADPALPLPRYRVRGQLTELRAADLRFTPEEAGAFLNQMMALNLSPENIATLEARTEGWIAGLQLAALSMQGRQDIAGFIRNFTGSHRFVLDYLVAEVLQHQSDAVRSFLLQTALLDRLCAPLCNAVTQREDGKDLLDTLERSNLFLIPLDDQRQWYRYHHLFAEILQARLLATQPDCLAGLHGRASAWYERNHMPAEAIRHALAAKDFERAAALIELAWPSAEDGSIHPAVWLNWVKALPDEMTHVRPVLNVGYAYALLGQGEMEAAQARLQEAETWLEPCDPARAAARIVVDQQQFAMMPANIAVARAYYTQTFGDRTGTIRYARRALELVPATEDYLRHVRAMLLLGMACWANGDLEEAEQVFANYTLQLCNTGNPDAIGAGVVLADIRLALGHLTAATRAIEQVMQFIMERGEPLPLDTADLYRASGELALAQGRLEAAAQHLQKSRELGEKAELTVWRYRWHITQAHLKQAQGDLDGALTLLDEAQRLYIRTPLPDLRPTAALKACIWVMQGNVNQALEWARERGISAQDDLSFLSEFEHLTLARILIAQYQNEHTADSIQTALQLLERLLQAAQTGKRIGSVIEILVLQALAYRALGKLPSAHMSLQRALILAEPEGYACVFMDEGQPVLELLAGIEAQAGSRHVKPYILKLRSAFNTRQEVASSGSQNQPARPAQSVKTQVFVEPLSERELEVLRLLRGDLSGPEIARELSVSLSTLRTHTQNIYAKLEVNHRRAAVRRAEELGLL